MCLPNFITTNLRHTCNSRVVPTSMAVAILLAVLQLCLGCNADGRPKSKVKIVEDYVLSANFDDRPPKVMTQNERILREDFRQDYTGLGAYYGESEAAERDLVLPGPPPPPHPPAISPYSVFAVGFISFLILLSSLQATLTMMIKNGNGGLLGALGKPSGRRRRSSPSHNPILQNFRN